MHSPRRLAGEDEFERTNCCRLLRHNRILAPYALREPPLPIYLHASYLRAMACLCVLVVSACRTDAAYLVLLGNCWLVGCPAGCTLLLSRTTHSEYPDELYTIFAYSFAPLAR